MPGYQLLREPEHRGALLTDRPAKHDPAIAVDDVVVADIREAALLVPGADVRDGKILALARHGAVPDNLVDRARRLQQLQAHDVRRRRRPLRH
ncbi:hypothetical protein [Bosea sp. WAO]|uniref:hypothetical protein n=1 Tax=Bosea sp. WAO TaxID=406341 RepID=UPI0012EDB447|nr:hypothetical protein [Bosea sp. WAO]